MAKPYPDLITLAQVRDRLRQFSFDDDDRLEYFRLEAQTIVLDYLKVPYMQYDAALPPHIRWAMLRVVESLYNGDDDPIKPIESVLMRSRDPAVV